MNARNAAARVGSWLVNAWDGLWFRPSTPISVSIGRVIIAGLCAHWLWRMAPWRGLTSLMVSAHMPRDLYKPTSFIRTLDLPPPSPAMLQLIFYLALLSALFTLIGAFTRLSSKVLAVTMLYLLVLQNCWTKVNHNHHALGSILIVLAFSRSGDWLSVDAWWGRSKALPEKSWQYTWPSQAWRLSFALMLFFASYSKMTTSGLAWITGPNLRNVILQMHHDQARVDVNAVALWVTAEPWRWKTAAALAVLTQFLFVGILFFRSLCLHVVFLGMGFGFLIGLRVLMDLPNPTLELLLLALIDYDGVWEQLRKWRSSRAVQIMLPAKWLSDSER